MIQEKFLERLEECKDHLATLPGDFPSLQEFQAAQDYYVAYLNTI